MIAGALRNFTDLPFRGVVRKLSGAEKKQASACETRAIIAGVARRSFLKGVLRSTCDAPPSGGSHDHRWTCAPAAVTCAFQRGRASKRRMIGRRLGLASLLSLVIALIAATDAPSAEGPACTREKFEGSRFTVCRYDPRRDRLRMVWAGADGRPLRRMAAVARSLGADRPGVRFAVNGGMFDDAGGPVGLYVEDGVTRHAANTRDGPGNFHLKPNGVFFVDATGAPHVETTERFLDRPDRAAWATQSGPMLVIDGALHPAIQADGPSRNIRNGVGVDAAREALFVISEEPVSFGRMARLFRDRLRCEDALYLDGSVSSLWAPQLKRMDDSFSLGPIIVVQANRVYNR